jgi:hypothetical protein
MNAKFWSGHVKGREHSEDLGEDERIKLELVLNLYDLTAPVARSCEHNNWNFWFRKRWGIY